MTDLVKRTLSGVVFVATMLGVSYYGKTAFLIVFLALMITCMAEFYNLILKIKSEPQIIWGIVYGAAIFVWTYFYAMGKIEIFTILIFFVLIAALFILELFRARQKPLHNLAFTFLGVLYIAIPFSILNLIVLNGNVYNHRFLIGMLLLVWGNDTGAYLFGVSLGKHKMFPRISPKKSWEGFFGGIIFTLFVAYLLSLFFTCATLKQWLILAAVASIFAVFGDLVESMFKRAVGVKDSGKFMPGHGGALDRFDALIMVIPMFYIMLKMLVLI